MYKKQGLEMNYLKIVVLLLFFPFFINSMQYQIKNDDPANPFKQIESMLALILSRQKSCSPNEGLSRQDLFVIIEKLKIDISEQRILKDDAIASIKNIFLLFDKLYILLKNKPNITNNWYKSCLLLEAKLFLKTAVAEHDVIKLINKIEQLIKDEDSQDKDSQDKGSLTFYCRIKVGKLYQKINNFPKSLEIFDIAEKSSSEQNPNKNIAKYYQAELILLNQNRSLEETEKASNLMNEIKSEPDLSTKLNNKLNQLLDFSTATDSNNGAENKKTLSIQLDNLIQQGKFFNFKFFTQFEQLLVNNKLEKIKKEVEYLAPVNKKMILSTEIDLHLKIIDELIKTEDMQSLKIDLLTIKSGLHCFKLEFEQYLEGLVQIYLINADHFSFIDETVNNFYEFEKYINTIQKTKKDYKPSLIKSIKKYIKIYSNLSPEGIRNVIVLFMRLNNYIEAKALLIGKNKNLTGISSDEFTKFLDAEISYNININNNINNNILIQKDPVNSFDYIKQIIELKNSGIENQCFQILTLLKTTKNKHENLKVAQNILNVLKNEKLDLTNDSYKLLKTFSLLEKAINIRDQEVKDEDENEKIFSELLDSSTDTGKTKTGKGGNKSKNKSKNKKNPDLETAIVADSSKIVDSRNEKTEQDKDDDSFDLYITSLLKNQTNIDILEKLKSPKIVEYLKNKIVFDKETSNIIVKDEPRKKQYIFDQKELNMSIFAEPGKTTYHGRIQKWFTEPMDELKEKNSNDIIESHSFCSAIDHIINIFGHNKINKKINKETGIEEEQEMKLLKGCLKKDGLLIEGVFEYTFYTNKENEKVLYHRIFRHKKQGL